MYMSKELFIVRPKNESPLGVLKDTPEDEREFERLLRGIANCLKVVTKKGGEYKNLATLKKKWLRTNVILVEMGSKSLENIQLEILPRLSNSRVSSYNTNELDESVQNGTLERYSRQTLVKQPRRVCNCHLNDDYVEAPNLNAPVCFLRLRDGSNPLDVRVQSMRGSLCGTRFNNLGPDVVIDTYFTNDVIRTFWKTMKMHELVLDRWSGEPTLKHPTNVTNRTGMGGSLVPPSFGKNQDFRDTLKGVCTGLHSKDEQCWSTRDGGKAIEQCWGTPKHIKNMTTGDIRKNVTGERCRGQIMFCLVQAETNTGKMWDARDSAMGWVYFEDSPRMSEFMESNKIPYSHIPFLSMGEDNMKGDI